MKNRLRLLLGVVTALGVLATLLMFQNVGGTAPYPNTYTCGVSNITPAATPTNIYVVGGSSNPAIITRITQIHFMGMSQTTGAIDTIKVLRQSTADTGGTLVADGTNAYDKNNPASTITCSHYTANPTSTGTVTGTLRQYAYLVPTATSFPSGEILEAFGDGVQPITLRNGEFIVFNMGGATVTGFNYTLQLEYTETVQQ